LLLLIVIIENDSNKVLLDEFFIMQQIEIEILFNE